MRKYNISNRNLILFLIITFGLTTIMGFAMGLAYPRYPIDSFPLIQMYYPAVGVMVTLLLNKERRKELPKNFFQIYLFFAITSIAYLLIKVFGLQQSPDTHLQIWLIIGSISLIFAYNGDDEKNIKDFGLKFRKNNRSSMIYILLFIFLYLICLFIPSLLGGDINIFIASFKNFETWVTLLLLPVSFPFSLMAFLGEEYGWRYFLQPALQERMGKVRGVIALGVIWGIWHLPINMFYYSPETSLHSVMNQLIVCVSYSVFFGFVYMKTENIWAISMIHFINNNLGYLLYGGTGTNLIFTWKAVLFNLLLFSIVYMPFLLSKDYRKSEISSIKIIDNPSGEIDTAEEEILR